MVADAVLIAGEEQPVSLFLDPTGPAAADLIEELDARGAPMVQPPTTDALLDWVVGFEGSEAAGCSPWDLLHALGDTIRKARRREAAARRMQAKANVEAPQQGGGEGDPRRDSELAA